MIHYIARFDPDLLRCKDENGMTILDFIARNDLGRYGHIKRSHEITPVLAYNESDEEGPDGPRIPVHQIPDFE